MKITDAFLGEHAVFYAQFAHLKKAIAEADCTGRLKTMAAMLASALASHAHLENDLLFASLEPHLGAQGGPLAVMRMEHDEIEGGLTRLQDIDDVAESQDLFQRVIDVACGHFAKEEQILYGMAEQILDGQAMQQLGDAWAKQRGVNIHAHGMPACHRV